MTGNDRGGLALALDSEVEARLALLRLSPIEVMDGRARRAEVLMPSRKRLPLKLRARHPSHSSPSSES
jgi:hypothetical protein